jgi:hypothetical protein
MTVTLERHADTHNSHKTLRQLPASSSCSRRQAPRLDASERGEGVDPKAWRGVLLGRGSAPPRRKARDTRLGALAGRRYGASSTPANDKRAGRGSKSGCGPPAPCHAALASYKPTAARLLFSTSSRVGLISGNLGSSRAISPRLHLEQRPASRRFEYPLHQPAAEAPPPAHSHTREHTPFGTLSPLAAEATVAPLGWCDCEVCQ